MRSFVACCLIVLSTAIANAQTKSAVGVFTGIVTSDTLDHPVSGAEIRLPQLSRMLQTNDRGEFRFADVPAGRYAVTVRAIGFETFNDSIDIAAGGTLDGDLTLTPAVTRLDSIRTTATMVQPVAPQLREFEARRSSAISGHFLSDSVLNAHKDDQMSEIIGMLPGVRTVFSPQGEVYLASSKAAGGGRAFSSGGGAGQYCLFTIYLDGTKLYQMGDGSPAPPDFSKMKVSDFAGVEMYASASQVPAQYSGTAMGCGVILLWSKPGAHG